MIHIVTVHWKDDKWIDIQLKYFQMFIREPFRVYAFLNFVPVYHQKKYFYSSNDNIGRHEIKLNLLGDIAVEHSINSNDWLIFIDGDAFPIGDIVSFGRDKLERNKLCAIQRKENCGDIQPHPSFCLTTIKFWKEIKGDWRGGYRWKNNKGKWVSDVGGNLLQILDEKGITWFPMLRSNMKNLHPLWFGIYENLIYHHGAGFRVPISRIDLSNISLKTFPLKIYYILSKMFPENICKFIVPIYKSLNLSEKIYKLIKNDTHFYKYFQ